MRILLADDHTLFRVALKKLLLYLIPNLWIKDVANGSEAMSVIRKDPIDILLLDLAMPIMDGFEVITSVKKERLKNFKIIALTNYTDSAIVYRLLEQGVEGYLPKNVDEHFLLNAVNVVQNNGIYYPAEHDEKLKEFISKGNIPNFKLSKNEIEIIKLLAFGKSSKEIAHILGYTVRSVETKRYRLERKMFARSSAELVTKAIKFGIVHI